MPHSATSKKLSKVETLREAARYIKHLQDLLQGTCDKPFEPLAATGESNNGSGMPASRENCCPAQQVPPIQTEYPFTVPNVESLPSQLYYQHYTANTAYYKPSACYLSCPVKSEIPSPSPSESSVELARYSHRNYALWQYFISSQWTVLPEFFMYLLYWLLIKKPIKTFQ